MKIRFLPILLILSCVFLVAKISDIIDGDHRFINNLFGENIAIAAEEAPPPSGDKKEAKPDDSNISITRPKEFNCAGRQFNNIELDILTNLSKRRAELDSWNKEIAAKEAILQAAEMRAESKIDELNQLKDQVTELLQQYNQKEDMKISSLVQIYENMKPKDAANILGALDMNILLQVIDRMNKSKTAPILAQMDPQIATQITTEFANQKKLPDQIP